MRKAISRNRLVIVSREYVVVSKMSALAQKVIVVPVSSRGSSSSRLLEGPVGLAEAEGLAPEVAAVLHLDRTSWLDSALTTETPTPCRPPETL